MLRKIQIHVVLSLLLGIGLLQGCATEKQRLMLEDTLNLYASAIRWGDFQGATQFFSDPLLYQQVKFEKLKGIKVSAYDVKGVQLLNDGNELRQTVEIRYYDTAVGSEHQFLDHQIWIYDTGKERWLLSSKMPEFN